MNGLFYALGMQLIKKVLILGTHMNDDVTVCDDLFLDGLDPTGIDLRHGENHHPSELPVAMKNLDYEPIVVGVPLQKKIMRREIVKTR